MKSINADQIKVFRHEILGSLGVYSDDREWFSLNDLCEVLGVGSNMVKLIKDYYIEGVDYIKFKVFITESHFQILDFVSEATMYQLCIEYC